MLAANNAGTSHYVGSCLHPVKSQEEIILNSGKPLLSQKVNALQLLQVRAGTNVYTIGFNTCLDIGANKRTAKNTYEWSEGFHKSDL